MRVRVARLISRSKIALAVLGLVIAVQLLAVLPVLHEARELAERHVDDTTDRAGLVYDRYARSRADRLGLAVEAIAVDASLAQALSERNREAIESELSAQAERAGIRIAAVFDSAGDRIASIGPGEGLWSARATTRFIDRDAEAGIDSSVAFLEGQPYHTVTAPIEANAAGAMVGFALPIDRGFVQDVKALTGADVTIVSFGVGSKGVYATTLGEEELEIALAQVQLGISEDMAGASDRADGWTTNLRPYLEGAEDLYVALQARRVEPILAFGAGSYWLVGSLSLSLLLALAVAFGVSKSVAGQLGGFIEAARRISDGVYTQPVRSRSQDEFAGLARGFNAMQEAIAARERDIVRMARHHSLSGLPTREIMVTEVSDAITRSHRLAVINLALHGFDELASSLGLRTADRLIQLAADRLCDQLLHGELLAHLNLQEFALALPGATLEQAKSRVSDIQTLLRSGIALGNANIALQLRAGIAMYPQDGVSASELLRCAAIARNNASHHMGSIGVYEFKQEERALELIQIVGDFPRALRDRELWLEFQPKIDCNTLALCGAEALARWHHPKLGRLPPDVFVEAIERAGGVSQLTQWVLEEAMLALVRWAREGLEPTISVNISADDLIDGYLPPFLETLCNRYAVAPGALTLEVTESSIMQDVESSLAVIGAVRELGCRISIDDFGTGHSSLAQLKRIPVDELKIDKSFVLNIGDRRDEAVVRTAIELAHKFGLSVVAEGVEDEACLIRLQQLGCEAAQGFYFSRSLASEAFVAWAKSWASGAGADIVSLVDKSVSGKKSRA